MKQDTQKLQDLINEIDALISQRVDSSNQEFISWHTKTERLLSKIYGKDSEERKSFKDKTFFPLGWFGSMTDAEMKAEDITACVEDLKAIKPVLQAYLDELIEADEQDSEASDDFAIKKRTFDKPTVFISYNWNNKDFAEYLEKKLNPIADVKRDDTSVENGESLSAFMKSIRKQDFAVIIISDDYLKSTACMYEITQLMEDEDWKDKTIFTVDSTAKVYTQDGRNGYVKYWKGKRDELEEKSKGLTLSDVGPSAEEAKKIDDIKLHLGDFLKVVSDTKNPKSFEAGDYVAERVQSGKH